MSKGQSAIEYLTTYGWMLLVVAIAGAAIFTTVQNQANIQSSQGFTGDNIGINNFETTSNNKLAMEVTAKGSKPIKINSIQLQEPDSEKIVTTPPSAIPQNTIPLGEEQQINISSISTSNSQNQIKAIIKYETAELNNLQAQGTITGNIKPEPGTFYKTIDGTIKCPEASPGETGQIAGKTYTAADNSNIDTLISNNQRICTTQVTDMTSLFGGGFDYNKDITNWDTSQVTSMKNMFRNANSFNQDIGSWDTSQVTNMKLMFRGPDSFNRDISNWCVSQISDKPFNFDEGAGFEGQTDLQPNWGTDTGCS